MTAAVITATTVAKQDNVMNTSSGTARRYKTLYLEGTIAADNDWFLLTTYLSTAESTQIIGWRCIREATGNAYAIEVATYDSDDAKFILTVGDAGPAHIFIDYYE